MHFFGPGGMPRCDIAVFVKERPEAAYRRAIEHGCHLVYMPVDFYRSRQQLDADGPFLASCSALLVHSRRLGRLLAEHNPAIRYVDHPNLQGLGTMPPFRPEGFRLWVGDFLNLPYLLRWREETGGSRDLRVLTNARRTSLRGMAMTVALARRLGVRLDVRADRVNGIPMDEWSPRAQRELMASAKAALDIKGGEDDFLQHTKPPTKAHQFVVSGIPFAANRSASAVSELLEDGFEVADVEDRERWLSREYWRATQAFGARLEERIRPSVVASLYRDALADLAARPLARPNRHAGPRPSGPPLLDEGRPSRLRAYVRAGHVLRAVGASWEDAAPRVVQSARAAFRGGAPGIVRCALRDGRATRPPLAVSVLVDLTARRAAARVDELSGRIPDTWEIVGPRSLRASGRHAGVRLKWIVRGPARGELRDRQLAAEKADGRVLAFVPRLGPDEVAWVADACAALERRPDAAVIRRDEEEGHGLDPPGTFVIRRDVWVALQGYDRGPSVVSPRCGDLDLLERVRRLGYAVEGEPGGRSAPADAPRRPSRPGAEVVVVTAIADGYDLLRPLDERCVGDARRIAFLDDRSRTLAGETGSWEIREIDWHDEDPVRLAKLPKVRPERFFPEAEYSLWLDGNVVPTHPFDLRRLVELYLRDADMCVFRHHARSCTFDEADACHVRGLDAPSVIDAQMARYREEGLPVRFGLHELPVVLRRHSEAVDAFDRLWWEEIARGSRRDQLSFEYVRWKTGLPVAEFPLQIQGPNGLFTKVAHRRHRPGRRPGARLLSARLRPDAL